MPDAPKRIWTRWGGSDGKTPINMPNTISHDADPTYNAPITKEAPEVEYTRSDTIPAMLAEAEARGREMGLREAIECVNANMEPLALKAYDVGYNNACTDAEDAILALAEGDIHE